KRGNQLFEISISCPFREVTTLTCFMQRLNQGHECPPEFCLSRSIWGWVVVGEGVIDFRPLRVSSRFILVFHILSPDRVEPARMNRRSPSRGRFANLCRPLNESAPSHLIQWFAKLGLCPEVFFYHKD